MEADPAAAAADLLAFVAAASPQQLADLGSALSSSSLAQTPAFAQAISAAVAQQPQLAQSVAALARVSTPAVVAQLGSGLQMAASSLAASGNEAAVTAVQKAAMSSSQLQVAYNAADAASNQSGLAGSGVSAGVRSAQAPSTTSGGGAGSLPSPN